MSNEESSNYFPFELSPFQKDAINAIKNGEHCLVTAHTGSGKTVPAEFAIQYFTSKGKRVIYTSPIKALSNQKLYDFRIKYPHISFGIVTGDIEDNKEAQVLIMTTEILSNSLLNMSIAKTDNEIKNDTSSTIRFTMDYENDLAAVVFDEVHYISDPTRGQAWEQSMMLLPNHVIYVMLSATISNPYTLINWITAITHKNVCLASTTERVVPLKHYVFVPELTEKKLKLLTNEQQSNVKKYANQLTLIKEGEGQTFNQPKYADLYNIFNRHMSDISPQSTIPYLIRLLNEKNMLPVLVFVFNRQQTETLADKLCGSGLPSLFGDVQGHDIGGKIEKECRHLLSQKIPNYTDFLESTDFQHILSCIKKGVAYHHAGMMPVLRELVEFLDSKGYIKVLFATETFAVGVNMPTRSVIFSSLTKYSEEGERYIKPHEYTQMAGRAGRRGLDTEGYCILLSPSLSPPGSLAGILTGKPTKITSNYKISYHLILGTLAKGPLHIDDLMKNAIRYSQSSLIAPSHQMYIEQLKKELDELIKEYNEIEERTKTTKTNIEIIKRYNEIETKLVSGMLKGKIIKTLTKEVSKMLQDNFYLERDYEMFKNMWNQQINIDHKKQEIQKAEDYSSYEIHAAISVLKELGFINVSIDNIFSNTDIGTFALSIYETHPLGLPLLLKQKYGMFKDFVGDYKQEAVKLAKLLSVFTDIKTPNNMHLSNQKLASIIETFNYVYDVEQTACNHGQFYLSQIYPVQDVITSYIEVWCEAETSQECIKILDEVYNYTSVSTGDFIKALLKIVKLSKELLSACEATNNLVFAAICNEIPKLLLKYIATSQSLYV